MQRFGSYFYVSDVLLPGYEPWYAYCLFCDRPVAEGGSRLPDRATCSECSGYRS